MSPEVGLALVWGVGALVVAAYIWFMVWRLRVDRRKKAARAALADDQRGKLATMPTGPVGTAGVPRRPPAPASSPDTPAPSPPPPVPTAAAIAPATVAQALSGVRLPHGLAPLTTLAARVGVGDRVAFWTDSAPADVVGPSVADELERLGFTVTSLDPATLAAQRDDTHLVTMLHPDGAEATIDGERAFPTVPERAVVVEMWIAD